MGRPYLFWAFTLLCLSCSNSGDNREAFEVDGALNGTWQLSDVSCFCYFGPNTYFGATTITFDVDKDVIAVAHTGNDTFFMGEGTYSYQKIENQLIFSEEEAYTFMVEGAMLHLTLVDDPYIADDEVTYSFIKL